MSQNGMKQLELFASPAQIKPGKAPFEKSSFFRKHSSFNPRAALFLGTVAVGIALVIGGDSGPDLTAKNPKPAAVSTIGDCAAERPCLHPCSASRFAPPRPLKANEKSKFKKPGKRARDGQQPK